jgi:hypothetical protein
VVPGQLGQAYYIVVVGMSGSNFTGSISPNGAGTRRRARGMERETERPRGENRGNRKNNSNKEPNRNMHRRMWGLYSRFLHLY